MKILLYTDVHFSQYSSILRGLGAKYSIRLEKIIDSINWAENLALLEQCNAIFTLGDFMDRSELNAEELTALKDIKWSGLSHVHLCGNHELWRNNNEFSSAHIFGLCPHSTVVSSPQSYQLSGEDTEIAFLPYCVGDKNPIATYFDPLATPCKRRIVFSHNDIKGINYGGYVSQDGFEIPDIENYCDLFLNGHLHNGEDITDKIINLGNLTGQNFSEDAFKYSHCAYILDTQTLTLSRYVNPHAFNFYKIDCKDVNKLPNTLRSLCANSVVTVRCADAYSVEVSKLLEDCKNIITSRVLIESTLGSTTAEDSCDTVQLQKLDHIASFNSYITSNIGNDEIIQYELGEISK